MMPRKVTPRQLAARKARAARGPLSPEARERLREAIVARAPWTASTGPRTPAGKARSRRNAMRHGFKADALLPAPLRSLLAELRAAQDGEPLPEPLRVVRALAPILRDEASPFHVSIRAIEALSTYSELRLAEALRGFETP
jgi:hypothetical protein